MTSPRPVRICHLLLLASCLALPVAAQDRDSTRTAPGDSANNVLLDISIDPAANERHVVFLQKGIVYRASFSAPGVTLRMRSLGNRQLPFVVDLNAGISASRASEMEIYPQSDGEIEFTVITAANEPVQFRLWSDFRATQRGIRSAAEGWWELGVDGLVGWHGNYSSDAETGSAAPSIGGCLSVRNGPGPLGFINGCILGAEGFGGDDNRYFSLFTEPQIRLSNGRRADQGWRLDWGAVFRYSANSAGDDGKMGFGGMGFGAYLARDKRDLNGKGWRYTLVVRADNMDRRHHDSLGSYTGTTAHWVPAVQMHFGLYR